MTQSTIQVWNTFGPIKLDSVPTDRFRIRISDDTSQLPADLQGKVDENWAKTTAKSPNAQDNPLLYLKAPVAQDANGVTIDANVRGFRYTAAFNRNKDFQPLTDELSLYRLLSISTHCHLLTKDKKLLFGTKKNQFNQISGFSGFPNVNEDRVEHNGVTYLDLPKTVRNRLRPEMGSGIVDSIDSIAAVGVTYVDTPGLRGTDSNYLVALGITAEDAQREFKESFQFDKKLFTVSFEPQKIRDFIARIHKDGSVMSRYALGCAYAVMKAYFGEAEAEKLLKTIREDAGVSIATENQTDYFKTQNPQALKTG